jgi:ATP-dependent Clp protease adaptor protein ClpS
MTTKHESTTLLRAERIKSAPPKMYKVMLLNDDYSTMVFVVEVLQTFFAMGREQAMQIMLKVHNDGSAVCGVYPKDTAETKVAQVTAFAMENGHPLRCILEEN